MKIKYTKGKQLSPHFNSIEFKCKCGCKTWWIDNELIPFLETLMPKIGSTYAVIVSGYRCRKHEEDVGGNGGIDYSHSGYAADIRFYTCKGGKLISSKKVVLACEDLGWNHGIGYKCGGNTYTTHIDSKKRKWYGDESKSMTASIGSSFYTYFKMQKPTLTFKLKYAKWFRKQPKVAVNKIKKLPKDTIIKSLDGKIYYEGKNQWVKTVIGNQTGYVCVKDSTGGQAIRG